MLDSSYVEPRALLRSGVTAVGGSIPKTGWTANASKGTNALFKSSLKALPVVGTVVAFSDTLVDAYVLYKADGDPAQVPDLAAKVVGTFLSASAGVAVGLLITTTTPLLAVAGIVVLAAAATFVVAKAWDRWGQPWLKKKFDEAIDPARPQPAPMQIFEAAPAAVAKAAAAVAASARATVPAAINAAARLGSAIAVVGVPAASLVVGAVAGVVASGAVTAAAGKVISAVAGAAKATVGIGAGLLRRWF